MDTILAFGAAAVIVGVVSLLAVSLSEWLERRRWSTAWFRVNERSIGVRTVGFDELFEPKGADVSSAAANREWVRLKFREKFGNQEVDALEVAIVHAIEEVRGA